MNKKLAKVSGRELVELFEDVVKANHHDPEGEIMNSLPDFTYQQLERELLLRLGEEVEEDEYEEDEEVEELDLTNVNFGDDDYEEDDYYD